MQQSRLINKNCGNIDNLEGISDWYTGVADDLTNAFSKVKGTEVEKANIDINEIAKNSDGTIDQKEVAFLKKFDVDNNGQGKLF